MWAGSASGCSSCAGRQPKRLERRFFWITGIGVVGVLEIGILAFCLRAEDALQLPFDKYLYGDLSPLSNETRFGHAFIYMTLAYALCAALLFLAWLTERRSLLWPAFLIGAAFESGLSLSGHSAVDAGHSAWSQLADWVHLLDRVALDRRARDALRRGLAGRARAAAAGVRGVLALRDGARRARCSRPAST